MENLKQRIKITETIINDSSGWNTDYWIKNILRNQVVIMESLNELLEEKNKPKFGKA